MPAQKRASKFALLAEYLIINHVRADEVTKVVNDYTLSTLMEMAGQHKRTQLSIDELHEKLHGKVINEEIADSAEEREADSEADMDDSNDSECNDDDEDDDDNGSDELEQHSVTFKMSRIVSEHLARIPAGARATASVFVAADGVPRLTHIRRLKNFATKGSRNSGTV